LYFYCGIPQKTVAAITNYTDRQIRNIRDRFGDFPREGKKRGRKKRKIKKRMLGG